MSARLACGNINIGGRGWYNFVIPFTKLALILQQISGASVYLHSGLHFSLVKPLYIAMWLHCLSILQNAFKRIRNHSNITKSAYTNPHPIPTPSPTSLNRIHRKQWKIFVLCFPVAQSVFAA